MVRTPRYILPNLSSSSYRAPFGFGNGHLQSIYPALFRKVARVTRQRERIETPDGDFLDLDWSSPVSNHGDRLAVLTHGLEGNSSQPYVQGMAAALDRRGWDILAWNLRGCGGESNRLLRTYHSGATEDLQAVLDHCFAARDYERVALVGFSLGGNLTLKYLGDLGGGTDRRLCGAVAFSVPCDLASAAEKMEGFSQRIYMRRFLKSLGGKIREKTAAYPEKLSVAGLEAMRTFREFDDNYTAPMNGFESAEEYWECCSSIRVLREIRVRTLLVNAADDPFLGTGCYPREEAEASDHFFFEAPDRGGHMGFVPKNRRGEYWSESRAAKFLEEGSQLKQL